MRAAPFSSVYRQHAFVDGSERKVANEYNFNHRLAHPVVRRWRRLLRVQSVWWSWARRRSGFGIDHSPRALVFWRSAFLRQADLDPRVGRCVDFFTIRGSGWYGGGILLRVSWRGRPPKQRSSSDCDSSRADSSNALQNRCRADADRDYGRRPRYATRHRDGDQRFISLSDGIHMSHHIRSSGTPSVVTASGATPHPITARSTRSRMRAAVSAGTSS
jgi:hypothetical protein